jgi:3-isopropylmalate/(R)-2-methylmalate dehydratase small subunit
MRPVRRIEGRVAVLDRADVDTDQIIPKQFLKRIERTGYGEFLFYDWRKDPDFDLNRPEYSGASILLAGRNFGCGSSREHAAWALVDHGFRAVISAEIADIFSTNALKNGLLPVIVGEPTAGWLMAHPGATVTIDVARSTLALPDGTTVSFPLEAFARHCLLEGVDELGFLLARSAEIDAFERRA